MRILPSGSTALLVELGDLEEVLAFYAALLDGRPRGVVDLVPASCTLLVVIDPALTDLSTVEQAVRGTKPGSDRRAAGESVEIPVVYDGADLEDVADHLGCDTRGVVERHTTSEWVVAFCGFAPGFGYLTPSSGSWDVPRRSSPRTKVPPGAVALAGEFSGIYPRESPGGWQLIGRTEVAVFDLDREPAALLEPGNRIRFVEVDA